MLNDLIHLFNCHASPKRKLKSYEPTSKSAIGECRKLFNVVGLTALFTDCVIPLWWQPSLIGSPEFSEVDGILSVD